MTANNDELRECPFCGNALVQHRDRMNPYARCETSGCFMQRCPVVNLDYAPDIEAWNTRANEAKGGEAVVCWSLAHKDGGGPMFADCIYDSLEDAQHDADALNGDHGDLAPIALYTSPRATAEDARDAERYRWLKRHHLDLWQDSATLEATTCSFNFEGTGHGVDQAIDAAIADARQLP